MDKRIRIKNIIYLIEKIGEIKGLTYNYIYEEKGDYN